MKIKYFYSVLTIIIIGFLTFTAFTNSNQSESKNKKNDSIIKFSHSLHSELTDCASCHTGITDATSLSMRILPTKQDCATCHDVEDTENCNQCHYDDVFEPLIQSESSLTFNHKFHLEEQKLECSNCHKGITEVDYSFQAKQPKPIMEDCFTCHNDNAEASNACESCHISTANLIPQTHKMVDFISSHKYLANQSNPNCVMCHTQNINSCETCHTGTTKLTEKNTANDFYQPYSPSNSTDGEKQQQINRVHDLNYRFTHGIDYKSKKLDCQTCHEINQFCAECHDSRDSDFSMEGIVPSSHLKPNFVLIGRGSGGGEHATLARRDIETCISCHDVQGQDPTCITCHTEN